MFFRILSPSGNPVFPGAPAIRSMVGLSMALIGCGQPHPPRPAGLEAANAPCRRVQVLGSGPGADSLSWEGHTDTRLEAWCAGVGPALIYRPETQVRSAPTAGDLTVVTWNVHAGGGDIDAFLQDLRGGRLGQPTPGAFVLLLQEVFRGGRAVPPRVGPGFEGGSRVAPDLDHRGAQSIEEIARRNELHLLYVPSMRNGGPGDPPEDRGNAILSTLPLTDLEAFVLPMERQRRVAVAARIPFRHLTGSETGMRVVSLHLDPRSSWTEFHRSFGAGRTDQARSLVTRFGSEPLVVLGGDLNTWLRGHREGAARILSETFPEPSLREDSPTVRGPGPLPDFTLDHLFFRLPEALTADYAVVPDRYGSDHHPVIGWISSKPQGTSGGEPLMRWDGET